MNPVIEIYCEADYSQLPALRRALRAGLLNASLPPRWEEYYAGWKNVPVHLAATPHPVVLVNHQVIWKATPAEYVSDTAILTSLLIQPPGMKYSTRWAKILQTNAAFLLAVAIAFFPKCPFCWAAYMSIFSFLGLNTIPYKPWLLPVSIAVFFTNIVSLYFNRKQHGYKLLLISMGGAVLIVLNRLYWNVPAIWYCGAVLLVTASLWNSLTRRMAKSVKVYLLGKRN